MTKGDSCDANPSTHTHRHTCARSSNQCASFTFLIVLLQSFCRLKASLVVVVLRKQGANYSDPVLNRPLQNTIRGG